MITATKQAGWLAEEASQKNDIGLDQKPRRPKQHPESVGLFDCLLAADSDAGDYQFDVYNNGVCTSRLVVVVVC